MAYPAEDTLMVVREVVSKHIYLLNRADIRLQDSTRSKLRLTIGTWVIRRWDTPRFDDRTKSLLRIRAFVSLMGTEKTIGVMLEPHEVLLVKGLPSAPSG